MRFALTPQPPLPQERGSQIFIFLVPLSVGEEKPDFFLVPLSCGRGARGEGRLFT
jgi:hypothetical protein